MLPASATEIDLYPPKVSYFVRSAEAGGEFDYIAPDGGTIRIDTQKGADAKSRMPTNQISCGDYVVKVYSHPSAKFPYAFSNCGGYSFTWINGDWVIHVWSSGTAQQILEFVNNYPY